MAINSFKGQIKEGTPESGGYFKAGASPNKDIINISSAWIDKTQDPAFRGKFVTMLGHEVGHAVMPGGHSTPTQAKTPQEYGRNALGYEGVAVTMEYRVARELGVPMWSDCDGSLKTSYNNLEKQHGMNTPEFNAAAKTLGAQTYASRTPSTAKNLDYVQYYESNAAVRMCQDAPTAKIDWQKVKPDDVTFTTNKDGSCTFTGNLAVHPQKSSLSSTLNFYALFPADEKTLDNKQELSPEIQALHDKLGEALHPKLAALNVSKNHADAMVSTHTLDCVKAGISAEDIKFTGVEPKSNLISTFHTKSEWIGVYTDAVAASRNNPEQSLQQAQQQLEQQPAQEQQRQQQLELQTIEYSGQSIGM